MPVYKIVPQNRDRRVLVTGSNLEDVIRKGREKLELPDELHKVVLDEDGTEVDEDDVLLEIGRAPTTVTLMLLSAGQSWKSATSTHALGAPHAQNEEPNRDGRDPMQRDRAIDLPELNIGLNVWNRFPKRLLACCEAGTSAMPSDRRNMVSMLADYMQFELKDMTRKCANRIAQHIVSKYPRTFKDTINDEVVGTGSEYLRTQLYNAVMYRKEHNQSRNNTVDENSDDDADTVSDNSRKRDEYGCADYQPLLPDNETVRTQEQKRLTLKDLFASDERNDEQIKELIGSTYSTQRLAINAKKRDLSAFLTDWPCFTKSQYLIVHASRLLGKDIGGVWNTMVDQKGKAAVSYFKSTYRRRERKRNSNKEPNKMDQVAIKGLEILTESKKSATTERSVIPTSAVMFPLVLNYFQEQEKSLYKVDTESTPDDELKNQDGPYPVLIIKGQTFYDEEARYVVIVERCLLHADSLLDGLLTVIIAYYVFGYVYENTICRTLEFIQRTLLGINPEVGHKRAGKQRKSHSFDPKVLKLSKEIEIFEKEDAI